MNWYEIDEVERTPEQKRQCRNAYFQTLLESEYGRQVYADLRRRVMEHGLFIDEDNGSEYALSVVRLREFMDTTRWLCGVTDDMAVIKAEREIADKGNIKTEVQSGLELDGFRQERDD